MADEVRILVVGVGNMGASHAKAYHRLPGFAICGLMSRGMTHRRAVLTLYAVCVAFGALSFVAVAVQGAGNAVVVGVAAAAMYVGIRALGYRAPRRQPEP